MYLLFFLALMVFAYGIYRHIAFWKGGRPDEERFTHPGRRLWSLLKAAVIQKKTFNTVYPGIFHALLFYSFLALLLTTAVILLDYDFGFSLFSGWVYLALSMAAEAAGILMLIGIGMALWRRYVQKPHTLDTSKGDTWCLVLLAGIVITGYAAEGVRMAVVVDPWSWVSPLGSLFSAFFVKIPADVSKDLHAVVWWFHTTLVMVWIAILPTTKFFHMLVVPANAYFKKTRPAGEFSRVDIQALLENEDLDEDAFNIGVGRISDCTWKQRMDFDACLNCGRCDAVCPANRAGQPLSPKTFIQRMRDLAFENGMATKDREDRHNRPQALIPHVFDENFIWRCRTCLACVEICPAHIEHLDTLIEIRRNEVSMQGRLPVQASQCLKTMESLGNPFASQNERVKWMNSLEVPVIQPGGSCDVLYWIGCFTALDPSKQKIAADLCELMKKIGVDFGVLGEEENCCGDPARVMGEENMFQMMAKEQVARLNQRKFKTLLVSCPHGYTVLKNEYPQFGGHYNVIHYTAFIYQMIINSDLTITAGNRRVVAYHDPCYLGRYQSIYEAPRKLIDRIPNIKRVEMSDNKNKSLCCGGGGGHFWMDFKEGDRINNLRVQQALDADADTIVTACPFCHHMLDDSVKLLNLEDQIEVVDIGTLIRDCINIK